MKIEDAMDVVLVAAHLHSQGIETTRHPDNGDMWCYKDGKLLRSFIVHDIGPEGVPVETIDLVDFNNWSRKFGFKPISRELGVFNDRS